MTTQNTIKAFTISANGKQTNFIAAIERESDKAILLDVIKSSGMTTYCKTWFPKSQINMIENESDRSIEMPEWLILSKIGNDKRTILYA
jgi:hypothetical protein